MKHKILYIDDEEINLTIFKKNFQRFFEIITTISPIEGFEIIKEENDIEVIIVDMRMPEMDGVSFVRKAKKICPENIYYILTGYDIDEKISEAIKEGIVNRFFMKPLDVETILLEINQTLDN